MRALKFALLVMVLLSLAMLIDCKEGYTYNADEVLTIKESGCLGIDTNRFLAAEGYQSLSHYGPIWTGSNLYLPGIHGNNCL
jgi:hypothetical protein